MSSDNLDSLVDEAISAAPPVSPVALREEPAPSDPPPEGSEPSTVPSHGGTSASGGTVEIPVASTPYGTTTGEQFDASIHETDASGQPVRNQDGTFRKKRGRKKGTGGNVAGQTVTTHVLDTDSQRLQKATASARAVVSTLFVLGNLIGGEEWQPIVDDAKGINEPAMLTQAYAEWFMTMENVDVPPWVGAAVVTASYVIPRVTAPKTASRLATFWEWLKSWFTDPQTSEA